MVYLIEFHKIVFKSICYFASSSVEQTVSVESFWGINLLYLSVINVKYLPFEIKAVDRMQESRSYFYFLFQWIFLLELSENL